MFVWYLFIYNPSDFFLSGPLTIFYFIIHLRLESIIEPKKNFLCDGPLVCEMRFRDDFRGAVISEPGRVGLGPTVCAYVIRKGVCAGVRGTSPAA